MGASDMKRLFFMTFLGIFVTTGLCDDTPDPDLPPPAPEQAGALGAPPPSYSAAIARLNKKAHVVIRFQVTRSVPLTATRVLRDGKEVKEKHTFYEWVTGWEDLAYDPKDIKLLGSDGKPLDKKMLPELLKKERPVVFTYGESEVDGTFLKVIKEGTPILVPPWPGPS
jgi:hypothetical protein